MIQEQAREFVTAWAEYVYGWLTHPLFSVGETGFSAALILKVLLLASFLLWLAGLIRRILTRRLFPRFQLETGLAYALANIVFYTIVSIGFVVGLQTLGLNLSSLTVLFGALGVGIGFGLQSIAANFVSGLVLLLERPIQVGDRVELGDLHGRVCRIQMRATEILTNDKIAVVVPNSQFITQQVINWSRGGDTVRVHVPVGVAYGSDVENVRDVLMEAARSVPAVLEQPPPKVWFVGFGDSSLDFEVLGWTRELLHSRGEFKSRLNYAIHRSLKEHGIEIPFPQRDLHVRSSIALPVVSGPSTKT